MDTADLKPLLEDLSGNIDDLEESLAPLLQSALSASASKLPLLDKAKLYVLVTYAIESILFSYIRLNGQDAKAHRVFTELARVKQYFEKIKAAENVGMNGGKRENMSLDKAAAGRFIKNALAGNEQYDRDRAAAMERQRQAAHLKLEQMSKKRKADEYEGIVKEAEDESSNESSDEVGQAQEMEESSRKKSKRATAGEMWDDDGSTLDTESKKTGKKHQKDRKKRKQSKIEQAGEAAIATTSEASPAETTQHGEDKEVIIPRKSHQPPRGPSAAFQALLKGPLPEPEPQERKKRRHKRSKLEPSTDGPS